MATIQKMYSPFAKRGFLARPGHKDMARHGLLVCLPTSLKGQWSGESGARGISGQQSPVVR